MRPIEPTSLLGYEVVQTAQYADAFEALSSPLGRWDFAYLRSLSGHNCVSVTCSMAHTDGANESDLSQQLLELVASNQHELALERLLNLVRGMGAKELQKEAVVQLSNLRRLQLNERRGILTAGDASREYARLSSALGDFIEAVVRRADLDASARNFPTVNITPSDDQLERVYGINHLKSIAWLEHGLLCARSVCRILLPKAKATGFMVRGGWLVTNRHVLESVTATETAFAEFGYEEDLQRRLRPSHRYRLDATTWRGSAEYDVACVKVVPDSQCPEIETWGALEFGAIKQPKVEDHVTIIQHPDGGPKMIAATANQVINIFEHRLQYLTDTLPGSSGSPVFDDDWQVVAVHRAGGKLAVNARGDRRFTNEGVLAQFVVEALKL